jgi:glycerol-3-phosphate acyltransferase PlsX
MIKYKGEVNIMIKIVVDCFGGDRSPMVNVEGAILAVNKNPDIELILAGDEAKINEERAKLENYKSKMNIAKERLEAYKNQ